METLNMVLVFLQFYEQPILCKLLKQTLKQIQLIYIYMQFNTYWRRLIGRKGLKLSSPSAWRFVGKEDAKSLLEEEAETLFDWPKMAVPSEPALYKDTELEDLEMDWEDKWRPDSENKDDDVMSVSLLQSKKKS